MDTAIKHPVPDRVKPSFVIFSVLSITVPGCQNSGPQRVNNNTMGQRETNGLIATIPDTCVESHISSAAYTAGTAT